MKKKGHRESRKVSCLAFLLIGGMMFTACADSGSAEAGVPLETEEEVIMVESDSTVTETEQESEEPTTVTETVDEDIFKDSGLNTFAMSSEDLKDGVWDPVISNTKEGMNVSPQLAWEADSEATSYVIYMVDTSAGEWIHWKSNNVTETNIPQGWAPESEYIGPYPAPGATHNYDIYVIALKQPVERAKGALKTSNPRFVENVMALDETEDGTGGNILGYGRITGTYTAK